MIRKSKLEMYEDIICTLTKNALTIDELAFECNTDCVLLQNRLDFLMTNKIVSIELDPLNRASFALTARGLAISKTVAITKRLKKLQTTPQASARALQVLPAFLQENEEPRSTW